MLKNQKAQQEMFDAVLSASRAMQASPSVAPERRVKPPIKPTLQKLSKEDDIESYLNMFERVAEHAARMAKVAVVYAAGRTALWRSSRCLHVGSSRISYQL